jgi:hypothetical protein
MKKPYADEYDASIERQFWGESSVRVAYVLKKTYNEYTTVDLSRVGQFTAPVTVAVPVRDFVNGVTSNINLNLFDLAAAPTGNNVITNVPDGHYKYDTLQFAFNKRFRSGLFIQSSYDYQWRDELRGGGAPGNSTSFTNTMANPSTSPLNSDVLTVGFFNNANPAVPNRQKSTNWQGRLIGRCVRPTSVWPPTRVRAGSRTRGSMPRSYRAREPFACSRKISRTTGPTRYRFSTSGSTKRSASGVTGSPVWRICSTPRIRTP